MKKLSLYIFVIIIGFMSCRKEELTDINIIETEDPTKIESVLFKGTVLNGNLRIDDAIVEVYQNEKLIGNVRSDVNGNFTTEGLKVEPEKHVTFYVKKENYVSTAKRFQQPKINTTTNFKINLLLNAEAIVKSNELQNPGSNELIILSGYIFDINGNPALKANVGIFYNVMPLNNNSWSVSGGTTKPDSTGYYEMLLPKETSFYYFVNQNTRCESNILTMPETTIFGGILPVQNIGPFSENTQLPILNNALTSFNKEIINISITSSAKTCQGNNIVSGKFKGKITIGQTIIPFEKPVINGIIPDFTYEYCIKGSDLGQAMVIEGRLYDLTNSKKSDSLTFTFQNYIVNLGDLSACVNDSTERNSQLIFRIGQLDYNVTGGNTNITKIRTDLINDTLFVSGSSTALGFIKFNIPDIKLGLNKINDFRYINFYLYLQENQDISINITSITADSYEGTFNGKVKNTDWDEYWDISGTLYLKK